MIKIIPALRVGRENSAGGPVGGAKKPIVALVAAPPFISLYRLAVFFLVEGNSYLMAGNIFL